MNKLYTYVLNNLYDFVNAIGDSLGLTLRQRSDLVSAVSDAVNGYLQPAIVPPLAFIMWVWQTAGNVATALPDWLGWLYNFVYNTVFASWHWVTSTLTYVYNYLNDFENNLYSLVVTLINNALKVWDDALSFADWLNTYFANQIADFFSDPFTYIYNVISPAFDAINHRLSPLLEYWRNVIQPAVPFLTSFLDDPLGFIANVFVSLIEKALSPFTPLLDFLIWWKDKGEPFMLALIENPVKVILDLIASEFIEWASQQIADNW